MCRSMGRGRAETAASLLGLLLAGCGLLSACASRPVAPGCPEVVTKWPGTLWFGDYEPGEVSSLRDLPEHVQRELSAHLRARLGEAVYAELEFAGGQAINAARLQAEPGMQWRVPDYHLHFRLSRPAACVDYYAEIDLDDQGRVINEIELPNVAAQGGELRIVSLEEALQAVRAAGHAGPLSADIDYRRDLEAIVWIIEPTDERVREGYQGTFVSVIVDARSGTIVETVEGVWIE